MRKALLSVLSTSVIVLALGIGTSAATATTATTWTISPGGTVTGTAGKTIVTDTNTGAQVVCTSSSFGATLKSGTGKINPLGQVTAVAYNSCTVSGSGFSITSFASSTSPWHLRGATYSSGLTHGQVSNIQGSFAGPLGCSGTFAGTSATTPGSVRVIYNNSTGVLTTSGGNAHAWNVSSCFGHINTGDAVTIVGHYKISPAQTITSP